MKRKAQLQIPGASVEFFSYVAYAIVVLLFFTIFFLKSCDIKKNEPIESAAQEVDINTMLINFLRTPTLIDINLKNPDKPIILKKMTVADLIALYKADNRFKPYIEEELISKIEPFLPGQGTCKDITTYDLKRGDKGYYLFIDGAEFCRNLAFEGLGRCLEGDCGKIKATARNFEASTSVISIPSLSNNAPIEVRLTSYEYI